MGDKPLVYVRTISPSGEALNNGLQSWQATRVVMAQMIAYGASAVILKLRKLS